MTSLRHSLFVALGGAAGTLIRHLLNIWTFTPAFPVGTVIENITGAFLLGIVTGWLSTIKNSPEWVQKGVGVGFCGGYTTTSTFAADTFILTMYQTPAWAAFYVTLSLAMGLFTAWSGIGLGKALGERRAVSR